MAQIGRSPAQVSEQRITVEKAKLAETPVHFRPGGRAAAIRSRIREAVFSALESQPDGELSVPKIAIQAGVAPSSIYRRWADGNELVADFALEFITESIAQDLPANPEPQEWVASYQRTIATQFGRRMLRALATQKVSPATGSLGRHILIEVASWATRSGDELSSVEDVQEFIDRYVAPSTIRALFNSPGSTRRATREGNDFDV